MRSKDISRRHFLKLAGVGIWAATLSGCIPPDNPPPQGPSTQGEEGSGLAPLDGQEIMPDAVETSKVQEKIMYEGVTLAWGEGVISDAKGYHKLHEDGLPASEKIMMNSSFLGFVVGTDGRGRHRRAFIGSDVPGSSYFAEAQEIDEARWDQVPLAGTETITLYYVSPDSYEGYGGHVRVIDDGVVPSLGVFYPSSEQETRPGLVVEYTANGERYVSQSSQYVNPLLGPLVVGEDIRRRTLEEMEINADTLATADESLWEQIVAHEQQKVDNLDEISIYPVNFDQSGNPSMRQLEGELRIGS